MSSRLSVERFCSSHEDLYCCRTLLDPGQSTEHLPLFLPLLLCLLVPLLQLLPQLELQVLLPLQLSLPQVRRRTKAQNSRHSRTIEVTLPLPLPQLLVSKSAIRCTKVQTQLLMLALHCQHISCSSVLLCRRMAAYCCLIRAWQLTAALSSCRGSPTAFLWWQLTAACCHGSSLLPVFMAAHRCLLSWQITTACCHGSSLLPVVMAAHRCLLSWQLTAACGE